MASTALLLLAAATLGAADRTLTVKNNCPYDIWPAVAGTFANSGYTGPRGWLAKQSDQAVTTPIPENWNFRVWPRRGCNFDDSGAGSCLAGNCAAGRDCADDSMGWANLLEVNMNQNGKDFWDISAVPGFVAPMTVTLSDTTCTSVACAVDLNADCPNDQMRIKDGSDTIACLSACMANIYGIGTGKNNSMNCCSGSYLDPSVCKADQVDYYSYFKDGCKNAYAYPRDDQASLPQVVFTCPSASAPSYTVTFCGDGDGVTTNLLAGEINVDEKPDEILNMPKKLAIGLFVLMAVLVVAAIGVACCACRMHDTEEEEEAKVALTSSSRPQQYHDDVSENELPVRRHSRRSHRSHSSRKSEM
ncbi:hypothetical protein JCM11641_000886 [Rhodosporidiobolus odoratus]